MRHEQANELIRRYFAGESTLEEERTLRQYFATERVADDLRRYAPLFAYWEREQAISAPPRKAKSRRLPRLLLGVAAALLLLLVVRGVHRLQQPPPKQLPGGRAATDRLEPLRGHR